MALNELHIETKHEELYFWGKINGEENDYFIAFGINYKNNYGFPKKYFIMHLLIHLNLNYYQIHMNIMMMISKKHIGKY